MTHTRLDLAPSDIKGVGQENVRAGQVDSRHSGMRQRILGSLVASRPQTRRLARRGVTGPISGQLDRFGLEILAERLEYLGNDAFGVEAGAGVHRGRRVVLQEYV